LPFGWLQQGHFVTKRTQKPINKGKLRTSQKIDELMCPNMQKKHAKFHEDQTIGGARTDKNVSFLLGVQAQNYGKSC